MIGSGNMKPTTKGNEMSAANALTLISGDIYATREQFDNVLCDRSINFEREAGFALQVLSGNEYAMKTAMNNRQSVINAVINIAAIGISLNPAKKQAYLVPRDNKICLDISYMGLMDLAMATGSVRWAQAAIVYGNDGFKLNGFDKPPEHTYNPFSQDRGQIVGVYVVVKTSDGEYLTHTMSIGDVYSIRDRSSAWKSGRSCPWKTDEGEMIKKTCVKQAYKYWPKTDRLETAIHHLNTDNGEGLAELEIKEQPKIAIVKQGALQGIGDDLPIERKQILEAVANAMIDHFSADDVQGAYEEYIGVEDDDEKLFLWKKLPSKLRTAVRKHGELINQPAEKAA